MKILKEGGHRLFERDPETARIVSEMLLDLEKNGLEAVRRYSAKFDDWNPPSFELSEAQVARGHRPDRPAGRPRHRFLPGQRPRVSPRRSWRRCARWRSRCGPA